ncbi:MAG: hypothetical protein ABI321_19365 [Polyangia bacterium]
MLARAALLLLISGSGACTVANPLYTAKGDAGSPVVDSSVTSHTDLASADLTAPPAPGCTTGDRACSATGSTVCQSGTFVADRTCPHDSKCADGYCAPPTVATDPTCSGGLEGGESDNVCFFAAGNSSRSCQPFVGSGSVQWVCAPVVGTGGAGAPCTTGAACRSGFCGSNGSCFRACSRDEDCPNQGNASTCVDVGISVEGQSITASSCIHV